MKEFKREELVNDSEVEAFCIVPKWKEVGSTAVYKGFLGLWANIPEQTHSLNVGIVEKPRQIFRDTDALITFLKEVPVGVVTADCVPILLHAPDIECVAAVHAGWKGTIGGIIDNVLEEMERRGAEPSKIRAMFGPSISKEVYEVDKSLGERFEEAGFGEYVSWLDGIEGKPHVDLQGVNIERLKRRGVKMENVVSVGECTYSNCAYHSYRRDGDKAGRQLTAIVLH